MDWLDIARRLQAMAQTGLAFAGDPYDRQRYNDLNAIAAEIIVGHAGLDPDAVRLAVDKQLGYATPKLDVRAAAFRDGRILLVREKADGRWCLPGGWADVGDSPSGAAEREVAEEAGLQVKAKRVIGVYDANRDGRELSLFHAFKLVFLCEILGGTAGAGDGTTAADFFPADAIPELSSSRTGMRHIVDAFRAQGDPGMATVFD